MRWIRHNQHDRALNIDLNIAQISVRFAAMMFIFAFSGLASAANSGITYQGRILKPDGSPLAGASVQFKMQIRTPDANSCLMFEEQQLLDMRNSNGVFALTINDGSGTRTDSSGFSIDRVFSNASGAGNLFTFNPSTCISGSNYAANSGDGRNLVVYFKDETMAAFEPMPSQKINFVPFAFEAKQIAGFTPASLVRVAEADGTLDTVSPLSNANYTELLAIINGTTAQYEKIGSIGGNTVPAMTSGQVLGWNGSAWTSVDPLASVQPFAKAILPTCGAGQFFKDNGANGFICASPAGSGTVTSVATGAGLTGGPITGSGTITLATLGAGGTGFKVTYDVYGRVTSAVALVEADIPTLSTGGKVIGSAITSGTIGGSTSLSTTGTIASGAIISSGLITSPSLTSTAIGTQSLQVFEPSNTFKVTIQAAPSLSANYALTLPTTAGASNQVLTTNGSGVLTWTTAAGTGISALTGDVTASGTGSVGATVALVGGSAAASVNTATVAANAATNLNTPSTIVKRDGSGSFVAGQPSVGSVLYRDTGANSVTLQAPAAVTTSYVLKLPAAVAGTSGQVLSSDTSGNLSWFTIPASSAPSGAAAGDLSGTYPNPSVATVGGSTAASVNTATVAANAATNLNTPSTIVKRDGSNNFASNVATLNGISLNNAGSILSITNPIGGAWSMVLPATAGSSGQVMATNGAGVTSWFTLPTALPPNGAAAGDLSGTYPNPSVATVGGSTAASVNTATVAANAATNLNTPSTIVKRDGSNNFASNVITANGLTLNNGGALLNIVNPVGGAWTMTLPATAGSANQVLATNGAGLMSWVTGLTASTGFINGGNSFGSTSNIGNVDNFGLNIKTNNLTRLTVQAGGNVGIGTTTPGGTLDVEAGTAVAATNGTNITLASQNAGAGNQNGGNILLMPGINTGSGVAGSVGIGLTPAVWLGAGSLQVNGRVVAGADVFAVGNFIGNGGPNQNINFATGNISVGTDALNTSLVLKTASSEQMRINASGQVGIGTNNPTYQLQLSTDSAAKPGTSTWTVASDVRLKDIRAPFTRGIDDLMGLHTIYFSYKKDNPLGLPSDKEYVGIRAQDAEKVIPEAVTTDDQGYLHVTNDSIIWTAVNAIKELYSMMTSLEAQVAGKADSATTDRTIASLKADSDGQTREIAELKDRALKAVTTAYYASKRQRWSRAF